jgi:hypothetical protein
MLRVIILAVLAACIMVALVATSAPAHAACERVGCTEECRWVGPAHRRCRERCRVRCWNDAPRYYAPAPTYSYQPPAYHDQGPAIPPELVGLGIIALVVGVIAAIVSAASGDSTAREIAQIEESALSMRAETAEHDRRINAVREYRAARIEEAEEEGRRQADEEWRRLTGV